SRGSRPPAADRSRRRTPARRRARPARAGRAPPDGSRRASWRAEATARIGCARARSSVGERSLHTREVAGSKPAAPILVRSRNQPSATEGKDFAMSTYAVVNPATGETVKEYATISDDDLRAGISRADEAHKTWSMNSTVAERAALVRRVGELHVERREELAKIIVREMGKPIEQALGELDFVGDIYGFYADNGEE